MEIKGYNIELRKTKNGSSNIKVPQEILDMILEKQKEDEKKKDRKYVFRISGNHRDGTQETLRNDVIKLLEESYIKFELNIEEDKSCKDVFVNEFEFTSQSDARDFALKILNTGAIFMCSLKEK